MGFRVLTIAPTATLRARFAVAGAWEPLSALADADRHELDALLQRGGELEDLPGRWQAALLSAEAQRAGATVPARASCCGGAGDRRDERQD